jgi:secreted PhoX family phosphatase
VRRLFMGAASLAVTAALALAALAAANPKPKPKPPKKSHPAAVTGVLTGLQAGFSTYLLTNSCDDKVVSTETGATYDMPDDFDNNQLVRGPRGAVWLVSNHELTKPVPGDFQGDATKCAVPEQKTTDDDDSDGWGSVSRLTLSKDGLGVTQRELITTGIHDLCAGALTPWKTFLTNEEFPFVADPQKRSGWVWEINPRTGAQKRLTGMGRYSHD